MAGRKKAPAAFVMNRSNPVLARGAALAGPTPADDFEGDVTSLVRTSDLMEVDPGRRTPRIHARV